MEFFNRFRKKDDKPTTGPTPPLAPQRHEQREDEMTSQAAPQVKEMSVEELKAKLDHGETPLIIDVREDWEYNLVHLPQTLHIPMNTIPEKTRELDKGAEIIVHCHHGGRSWSVAAYMLQNGFTHVTNLTGGIDSWARRIDRTLRTY